MHHGLKPIKRHKTDRSFHRTFGGVAVTSLPAEFSVDAGLTMPSQITPDFLPMGCTGFTQQELVTDQDGVLSDHYRDHYTKTLELEGAPMGSGCDIRDSLKVAILYYNRGAYYAVESSKMDWFDSIRSVMYTNFTINKMKCAVSIGTPWPREWDVQHVNATGIIPEVFTGDPEQLGWHNWAIKGWKVIDGIPYLVAKTWQGTGYGDAGWSYYSREVMNKVMKIKQTGAFTLAPKNAANVQTVKMTIMESILRFIQQVLGLNKQLQAMQPITTPPIVNQSENNNQVTVKSSSQKLYDIALSLKGQYLTLDTTVPKELNCAETMSVILQASGYAMPKKGYAGTVAIHEWLKNNCDELNSADAGVGDIIISITQGSIHGHVGILGHDAILSNDSQTGTLESDWSLSGWLGFYQKDQGLVTKYYRLR